MQQALSLFKSPAAQSAILAFINSGQRFAVVTLPTFILHLKRGRRFFVQSHRSPVHPGLVFIVVIP